eukprot:CAMPEP_0197852380 /NCGR_PEP_ID=MMETSP1438-20131217/20458_1 /TAXON_ID=1461541 /ORGANISM="Pterosperma sp., Strain CCMP1384" /LENGTH=71 /DNA_ID=CAMNT_0043466413 /DNA_START=27 /DNA_END=242 /DNA_ORIENTATION=+
MARGQQKIQAQAKNAAKKAADKKANGPKVAQKFQYKCKICMAVMMSDTSMKEHFENKHPKETFNLADHQMS